MLEDKVQNVTVLLPTYNSGEYIKYAINSILNQTFREFELLIIDDGSTDNTIEIIKQFDDKRINYKKIEHSGISCALNYGLAISRYEWIIRMDADDISLPDRLKVQIEFLNHHRKYSVISSWYTMFGSKKVSHFFKLPISNEKIIKRLSLHSTLCHPGSLIKKKVITDVGGYRNTPFEDYDLWLRLKNKVLFYNIPEVLILVRNRKDSLLRKSYAKSNQILHLQRKYFSEKDEAIVDNNLNGWREWFYGNKKEARRLWLGGKYKNLFNYRILLAILLSLFPIKYFEIIKRLNLKARIDYIFLFKRKDKKRLNAFISNQK